MTLILILLLHDNIQILEKMLDCHICNNGSKCKTKTETETVTLKTKKKTKTPIPETNSRKTYGLQDKDDSNLINLQYY